MALPAGFRPLRVTSGKMDVPGLVKNIEAAIMEAAESAVEETTLLGVKMAKRIAPRRKVSYIDRKAKRRQMTRAEILRLPGFASQGARGARGRVTGTLPKIMTTTRQATQYLDAPEVEDVDSGYRLKNRRAGEDFPSGDETFLTGRGISELNEVGRTQPHMEEGRLSAKALYAGKLEATPDRLIAGTSAIYTQRIVYERKGTIGSNSRTTLGGRLRGEIRSEYGANKGGKITHWIVSPTEYARYVELPTSRTAEQPYLRPTLKALRSGFKRRVFNNLKRAGLNPHPL